MGNIYTHTRKRTIGDADARPTGRKYATECVKLASFEAFFALFINNAHWDFSGK
jgi:hypothetical protein